MTFPADDPRPEPTTQHVPAGRRAALVIATIAVLVIGTLAWKPWENGTPAGQPATSPAIAVAVPTARPSPAGPLTTVDAASPAASEPVNSPTATPSPTPTPELGPQFVPAPDNLGSVAFVSNEGPPAWCIYRSPARKTSHSLSIIVVEPPIVMVDPAAMSRVRGVRWHVDLETNSQDKLFEAEWRVVDASSPAVINEHQFGFTKPLSVRIPKGDSIAIYRAPIVVDWLGERDKLLATQRAVPADYGALGGAGLEPQPAGCLASI